MTNLCVYSPDDKSFELDNMAYKLEAPELHLWIAHNLVLFKQDKRTLQEAYDSILANIKEIK